MASEHPHPPAAADCLRCHRPHDAEVRHLLVKTMQPLCGECHDAKSASFSKAHIGIDAAVMDCMKCHDPHASNDPKFLQPQVHPPFAGRSCDDCHVVK